MPTTPRTRAEDAATYYETRGDGRPIVFVHGGWSNSEMWAPQVQSFAAEYRTITYDVRGHGRTTDWGSEPYSIERFVEDLRALIDTLDAEDPILCGLSLGGIIAQTYAATYPEDVGGLVLADTTRWIPPLPISLSGLQKRTLFPKPAVHSYIRAIGVEAYFRQLLAGIQAIEGHQWLALTPEVRATSGSSTRCMTSGAVISGRSPLRRSFSPGITRQVPSASKAGGWLRSSRTRHWRSSPTRVTWRTSTTRARSTTGSSISCTSASNSRDERNPVRPAFEYRILSTGNREFT
ncbi:hypothetical protein BRC77_08960 [Halobacteriales archaeon QH_8_64_26]|nr:MAG: hypothetical protein BRC77_08960 [Halobacteriales archaeon QH_8_64_26]